MSNLLLRCSRESPIPGRSSLIRTWKILSQDILTLLCEKYPNNVSATMELKRVRCRLGEQERSAYDIKAIREEMSKVPPPHLDHATFVGPVTVKVSMGRGRGLYTTKAVKAGDLILCEKVFAHCYANAPGDHSAESSRINLLVDLYTSKSHDRRFPHFFTDSM